MNARRAPGNDELPIPEALGPWILLDQIGEGGFGRVFKARHRLTAKLAAVKVLNPDRRNRDDIHDRFLQEIGLLSAIDNMNVVRFYDADITPDGLVWMAMEFLVGDTLGEHMQRVGRFSVGDALRVIGEISDGLSAAHLIGVVHRDLKPPNVFVTSQHVIKVLDFGISKLFDRRVIPHKARTTEKNKVLGTWTHLAPEQLEGKRIDYRADVFALGIIGYELLTGRHPFIAPGETDLSRETLGMRILMMTPAPLHEVCADVPPEVWFVLKRALEKEPDRRYPSLVDFKRALVDLRAEYLVSQGLATGPLASLLAAPRGAARPAPAPMPDLKTVRQTLKMEHAPSGFKTVEEALPAGLVAERDRAARREREAQALQERERREAAAAEAAHARARAELSASMHPQPPAQVVTPRPPAVSPVASRVAVVTPAPAPVRPLKQPPPASAPWIQKRELATALLVALVLVVVGLVALARLHLIQLPGTRAEAASASEPAALPTEPAAPTAPSLVSTVELPAPSATSPATVAAVASAPGSEKAPRKLARPTPTLDKDFVRPQPEPIRAPSPSARPAPKPIFELNE